MTKIGKYEILEKIGVGGFGEVFKARDPFIKRLVAVKTCTSGDEDTRRRFFQEAEIAGRLSHRNITTVYDFGIDDSLPYLIQEYLSGEDLDRKIKRRDYLPFAEKLHYLIQIARGLAFAHREGVIHRDVKPANVRVLEDGTVKIMDFGIAKLAQQETSLTKTGMTVGTAAYLAPEQIRGDPVDVRTDVFSFGVLAYELLTFERPFQGEQISAVIYQILNREPRPIRETWPTAPAEVVELIARCLAKDLAERFADAGEALRFLETLQMKRRPPDSAPLDVEPADAGGAAPSPAPRRPASQPLAAPREPTAPTLRAAASAASGMDGLRMDGEPERRTLDDLELSAVRLDDPARSRSVRIQGVARARPSYVRYVVLVLLPIVALAAGWGLGNSERRRELLRFLGWEPAPVTESTEETPTDAEVEPAPKATPTADVTPPPISAAEVPPPSTSPTPEPVAPAPPPPPSEPEPGHLVVAKVEWTDAMTVQVGRFKRYPLTRERTFPLPPGRYQVFFELSEPDYQVTSESILVALGEGETIRLETPIVQPGVLSVRAGLRKPQGRVTLDDEELGESPVTRWLAPGEYRLRILPLSGEGEGIDRRVSVEAGKESVLTFDLAAGTVSDRVRPIEKP